MSSVSLDFPCHIAPTPCAWLYILKTKLILSGHDLDSCPCSLFWYNCPIIYPSPCSGLAVSFLPCGGMTFPPELDEHESLPLLQNLYLSHIYLFICLQNSPIFNIHFVNYVLHLVRFGGSEICFCNG